MKTSKILKTIDDKEYYTVKEVADILNVKPNTVYRWIYNGTMEITQRGKKGAIRVHYLDIPSYTRNQKLSNIGETEGNEGK